MSAASVHNVVATRREGEFVSALELALNRLSPERATAARALASEIASASRPEELAIDAEGDDSVLAVLATVLALRNANVLV